MVFEIFKYIIFKYFCNNVSIYQLLERSTGVLKVTGSYPGLGEFFSLKFLLMRK